MAFVGFGGAEASCLSWLKILPYGHFTHILIIVVVKRPYGHFTHILIIVVVKRPYGHFTTGGMDDMIEGT